MTQCQIEKSQLKHKIDLRKSDFEPLAKMTRGLLLSHILQ
jgi:hypothetical protein